MFAGFYGNMWPEAEEVTSIKYMLTPWLQMDFLHKNGIVNPWADIEKVKEKLVEYKEMIRYLNEYKPDSN